MQKQRIIKQNRKLRGMIADIMWSVQSAEWWRADPHSIQLSHGHIDHGLISTVMC